MRFMILLVLCLASGMFVSCSGESSNPGRVTSSILPDTTDYSAQAELELLNYIDRCFSGQLYDPPWGKVTGKDLWISPRTSNLSRSLERLAPGHYKLSDWSGSRLGNIEWDLFEVKDVVSTDIDRADERNGITWKGVLELAWIDREDEGIWKERTQSFAAIRLPGGDWRVSPLDTFPPASLLECQ